MEPTIGVDDVRRLLDAAWSDAILCVDPDDHTLTVWRWNAHRDHTPLALLYVVTTRTAIIAALGEHPDDDAIRAHLPRFQAVINGVRAAIDRGRPPDDRHTAAG